MSSPPSPHHRRGPWSNNEDTFLMQLVARHGPLNWVKISATIGSRTPKQCRERYHQNLKPSLNHSPITQEEGLVIEKLVRELGKRWAEIARRLDGRSDNAVKNWWNGSQNRRKRQDRRRTVQIYDDHQFNGQPLAVSTTALPPPRAQSLQLNQVHRHPMSWVEAPLPSPCSSETAESDAGSNYTTSPPHHRALPIRVQLPPLRSNVVSSPVDPKLPSLSALASPSFHDSQPRLPPLVPQTQLLTAPNSPQHQQLQMQQQTQMQKKPKDSRMNLNSLLG